MGKTPREERGERRLNLNPGSRNRRPAPRIPTYMLWVGTQDNIHDMHSMSSITQSGFCKRRGPLAKGRACKNGKYYTNRDTIWSIERERAPRRSKTRRGGAAKGHLLRSQPQNSYSQTGRTLCWRLSFVVFSSSSPFLPAWEPLADNTTNAKHSHILPYFVGHT